MKTDTRPEALAAASDQQVKEQRLAADLDPNAPAKVPVPVAMRAEPSPWERFSGGHVHRQGITRERPMEVRA